jgi:hypothetical protein
MLGLGSLVSCQAATVWSDDFNDGNYDGWTVNLGSFSATSNRLESAGPDSNYISHPSTVATGTWSFDLSSFGRVYFMASDLVPGNIPENGYFIYYHAAAIELRCVENSVGDLLDTYPIPALATYSFDITRDTDGNMYLYLDGELIMQEQNLVHDSSTHFFVCIIDSGIWIDNIDVSDTVDIEPPTTPTTPTEPTEPTTPTGIPGFPAFAVGVGIVTALGIGIILRRRKAP